MIHRPPRIEPELEAFLAPGKIEPRLPPELREHVLARARSVVSSRGLVGVRGVGSPGALPSAGRAADVARSRLGVARMALAASVAVAVGAAGAVAALRTRTPHAEDPPAVARVASLAAPPHRHPGLATPALAKEPAPEPARAAVIPAPGARHGRAPRGRGDIDPFKAELALLQPAHVAYANGDYLATLKTLAEHARLFPQGRLAEEREALRVESLRHLGRREEAQSAATAFAKHFPHSILLSRVREGQQP
jgi:hypothetical protein